MRISTSAGAALQLQDLTKRFSSIGPPAVDRVNLAIQPGEFLTLLGPSGSGKTTTLNMIAGFVDVTSGRIDLDGTDISPVQPHRRNFGMVFQNYSLFPHMTVWDNVAFSLRERRIPKEEVRARVGDILRLVQLTGLENRKPNQLSGGQQQRVAFARAVVFSPDVLLLDEPLGALDRRLRQRLQAEIKTLHREIGSTFVFVTHDQDEAMFLSDRIAVFNQGRIESVGTPRDLYENPTTRFVAEFLGESNVFAGELRAGRDFCWLGVTWRVQPSESSAKSGASTLIVRPERLRIALQQAAVPVGANSVEATVTNYAYLGTVRRVEVEFPDGSPGCAVLPPTDAVAPRPGDRVMANWDPAHQRLVEDSSSASEVE